MPPTGLGKKKILFVAEAPGEKEDKANVQLVGKSGQLLRRTLRSLGISLDKHCWKTNAVICRPPENEIADIMINSCRPNLMKTIKHYNPNVIVLLGTSSIKSMMHNIWEGEIGALNKWQGWTIPNHKPNAWIIPTYHPSYILRRNSDVLDKMFKNHLKKAVELCKRKPWKEVPDYINQVEIIYRPSEAAKILKEFKRRGDNFAFDYEGTCLKPEIDGAEIVSCSVCLKGKRTIAYPWEREAIDATAELLKGKAGKIASNIKFEHRWTKKFLGFNIKNWFWDTMIAAHVIDNRSGITSVKFQSLVLLGMPSYDEHIKPYLKTKKQKLNKIKELNLKDLLLYNALDSLLEYKVAMKQIKILGDIK